MLFVFPDEREVFFKETNAGLYSFIPYYFGRLTADLPHCVLLPLIASVMCYFILNLNLSDAG